MTGYAILDYIGIPCILLLVGLFAIVVIIGVLVCVGSNIKKLRDAWLGQFLVRFMLLLLVMSALLAFMAVAICRFDCLNIVHRATSYFAPYSSSVPFLLIWITSALVCCIPGGPTALLNLSKRLKKAGTLEFFPAEDPDVSIAISGLDFEKQEENKLSKLRKGILTRKYKKELKGIPQKGLVSALKIIDDITHRKENIIDLHAGQIGAVLIRRNVMLAKSELFFDAYLKRGNDQIAVRMLPLAYQGSSDVAKQVKELLVRLPTTMSEAFYVHFVFYTTIGGDDNAEEISRVRRILFNFFNTRLFFYSITGNNAVAPMDEVP